MSDQRPTGRGAAVRRAPNAPYHDANGQLVWPPAQPASEQDWDRFYAAWDELEQLAAQDARQEPAA